MGIADIESESMSRPNLLYILTDQQRYDTLVCYGNRQIQTPHLNRLAGESYVFEHAYVTQPVCSPARASLMTGLYPHACGVTRCNIPLPADLPTLAELLPDEYTCTHMGKWHLGDEIFAQHGFSRWVGSEDTYRRFYSTPEHLAHLSDYHHFLAAAGFEPDSENLGQKVYSRHMAAGLEEPYTKAAFLGQQAARFLDGVGDRPFVLVVSYLEPHPPHTGPFNDLYDPAALPVGPSFRRKPAANTPLLNRVIAAYYAESEEYGIDLRSEAGWREVRARYWGNITLVDRSVGAILRSLEENGLAEDTIVVHTSDHGEMAGDHGILGKTVLYEEAIRVPLLLRVPAFGRQQRRVAGNFSHIDLLPTLLELLGEPLPDGLQGMSRTSVLAGVETLAANPVYIQWNERDGHPLPGEAEVNHEMSTPWRSVITPDRWKLNLSAHDQCELYNLNSDPAELSNLYDDPGQQDRVQALRRTILQWQEAFDDSVPLP
jgi:arylsulfatase A-like enzyme